MLNFKHMSGKSGTAHKRASFGSAVCWLVSKLSTSPSRAFLKVFTPPSHLYSLIQTLCYQHFIPQVCANTALNPPPPTLEMDLSSVGASTGRRANKGRYLIKHCNYPGINDYWFFTKGMLRPNNQVSYGVQRISQCHGRHKTRPKATTRSVLPPV